MFALVAAAALVLAAPAYANRIALVVGNDDYQSIEKLQKARADAKAYADALREKGFDVREGYDLSRAKFNAAIAGFVAAIEPGDMAVFVYSGHGWSDGTQNYLIGVDAPKQASEDELAGETIPIRNGADGVLDRIERKGATLRVVIIDACRDNPFTPLAGHRGYGQSRGFAPMTPPPQGTFVVFSASPGQSALDRLGAGDPDPNGVFSRVFVPLLRTDASLQDAVKSAQEKVVELARESRSRTTAGLLGRGRRDRVPVEDVQAGEFAGGRRYAGLTYRRDDERRVADDADRRPSGRAAEGAGEGEG